MRGSYRGYDIISAPPPSSGGTALLEALNILEGYDLAKFRGRTTLLAPDPGGLSAAFFDRAEFMAIRIFPNSRGPAHRQTIWRGLAGIDQSGACQRQQGFGPAGDLQPARTIRVRALPAQRWRGDESYDALFRGRSRRERGGDDYNAERHVRFPGHARGSVFLMNDEMDDFAAKPGVPNMYGLIQGPANAVAGQASALCH